MTAPSTAAAPSIAQLLRDGGVFYDVFGHTKRDVLRELVVRIPLTDQRDRDVLFAALEAREAEGSTGIGDGMAIPHARGTTVAHMVTRPQITLCLLPLSIEFGAPDGKAVHALWLVLTPPGNAHVRILAQLGALLRDTALRALLRDRRRADEIVARVDELERAGAAENALSAK